MKIGMAGPITLPMLANYVDHGDRLPCGYEFPMLANLVIEFLQKGHQVTYYTLDPKTTEPTTFFGENLTIHIGRYRPHKRARDFFAQERTDLIGAMLSDPSDIIHAHWTYEFALAALATGLPCLVTAHDAPLQILRYDHSPYRILRTVLSFSVVKKAKYMTAVSPYIADYFRRIYKYKGQLSLVPNGLPESIMNINGIGKNKSKNKVIFASILNGWQNLKNTTSLLYAFSRLREKFPEVELWLFGNGHGPGQIANRWAVARKLEEGVNFIGSTQYLQMLQLLARNVDVLVHPSLEESFGMAIVEGMALGLPVIAGENSGGVPYVLGNGEAGYLVDVKSISALESAMVKFTLDPDLRKSLGLKGYNYMKNHFTLDKVTDQYMDIYRLILRSS
jgi:L-malate glycosyltransferase